MYPSVTERYFTPRYVLDIKNKPSEDQCVLFHSNRICVITLAPSHPLITEKREIKGLDFRVSEKLNRLDNKVSGKSKKGAQWLNENSPLCKVQCKDGTSYILYSCVRGKLIEVNDQLIRNPELLASKTSSNGYIAIVLPKFGESETQREALLTKEQYEEKLLERKSNPEVAKEIQPSASQI